MDEPCHPEAGSEVHPAELRETFVRCVENISRLIVQGLQGVLVAVFCRSLVCLE